MNVTEKLEQLEKATAAYIAELAGFAEALKTTDMHFIPELARKAEDRLRVDVVRFPPNEPPRSGVMGDVPAALFYEEYRARVPEILAGAQERAWALLTTKLAELESAVEKEETQAREARQALQKYRYDREPRFDAAPEGAAPELSPPGPEATPAPPQKGRRR